MASGVGEFRQWIDVEGGIVAVARSIQQVGPAGTSGLLYGPAHIRAWLLPAPAGA